jgi:hypothetical protein
MSQTIKIKRSTGSAAPSDIAAGELAYSKGSGTLYIGDPDTNNANNPLPIGGAIINNAGVPVLGAGVTAQEIRDLIDLGTSDSPEFTDLVLSGNLTVNGTTTTLNTATLDVEDKNITLNYGTGDTSGSANGAGITVQDAIGGATPTDASITWNTTGNAFNFSTGIQVDGTEIVSSTRRFAADNGTTLKAGYGFEGSSTSGLSYDPNNRDRVSILVDGTVQAYVQTGSSNPIVDTMYVNGRLSVSGDGHSGNWKTAYDKRISSVVFNTSDGVLTVNHANATTTTVDLDGRYIQDINTGVGLSNGNLLADGSMSVSLNLNGLTDLTSDVDPAQDSFIILDNGSERKKHIEEIPISALRSGGTNGSDLEFDGYWMYLNGATGQTNNVNAGLNVRRYGTGAAGNDAVIYWNESAGKWYFGTEGLANSVGVGDITAVTISSTDGSIGGTGTGTSGDLTFDLEVATIDGGTY